MTYRCIAQLQEKADNTALLCRLLGVSRSGFYAACSRRGEPARVCPTSTHLRAAFTASGRCYGSRRLRAVLHAQGLRVGRYRIRTLMRINGLRPVWRRKFIHTTDSRHGLPIADNVLNRHFTPATANAAWVSDITYIRTRSGWLYLAAVLDCTRARLSAGPWRRTCLPNWCARPCRWPLLRPALFQLSTVSICDGKMTVFDHGH
jgi:putative transposase